MWFKNLQLYRLGLYVGKDALMAQLARCLFQRCPSNQPLSLGWVPPRENGDLVHAVGGQWLICLAVEQRLLPSDTVNRTVRELADQAAAEQGYAVGRKGLRELRERVVAELLPKAFTRVRRTYVWIDPMEGWLGIDAGTKARADEVIDTLRHSLDTFPVRPLHTRYAPCSVMADWLLEETEMSLAFTVDRDCQLKAINEEKAVVSYRRCQFVDQEIKAHLAAGKLPTYLALTWDSRLSFVLTERLEVKRLAFLDLLKEQADAQVEHIEEQFDADFALMTGELGRFLPALVAALGGEVRDES